MKGYITLSTPRSGSTWMSTLANSTGVMGVADEWLQLSHLEKAKRNYTADEYFHMVMEKCVTENGRFAMKVFPSELYKIYYHFGYDFVQRCAEFHDITLVLLRRKDTLGQAISWSRAVQNRMWHSVGEKLAEERYDYRSICRRLFYVERGYQFLETYLNVYSYPYREFIYEDLVDNPSPYLEYIAEGLGVEIQDGWSSDLKILRDATTEAWRVRFQEDVREHGVLELAHGREQPSRTSGNILRLLRKEPLFPYPFHPLF